MTIYRPRLIRYLVMTIGLTGAYDALAVEAPDIVYLNRCAGGCQVQGGADDAINGKSSLISGSHTAAAFPYADSVFDETAACVRTTLAPYNVQVRITGPGAVPRREIMLTTVPATVGLSAGSAEAAPFDGSPRENAIAFVFATSIGPNVESLCWITAEAIGNLYALDFVTSCLDIMSWTPGCGVKSFTNQDAPCSGAFGTPGQCFLGNTTQNSAAMLGVTPGPTDIVFENGLEAFQTPRDGPSPPPPG